MLFPVLGLHLIKNHPSSIVLFRAETTIKIPPFIYQTKKHEPDNGLEREVTMKRILALVLSTILLMTSLGLTAFAADIAAEKQVVLTKNPSGWKVVDPLVVDPTNGTPIFNDAGISNRKFTEWLKPDEFKLDNAVLVQTSNSDVNAIKDNIAETYGSFTINHTADIYVALNYSNIGASLLPWVYNDKEYRLVSDSPLLKGYNYNYYLFKKRITVAEGETAVVELGHLGSWANLMYSVIVDWVEEPAPSGNQLVLTKNPSEWKVVDPLVVAETGGTSIYTTEGSYRYYAKWVDPEILQLNNAVLIQTNKADINDPVCNGTTPSEEPWAAFTINHSANIYIACFNKEYTGASAEYRHVPWLSKNGYQLVADKKLIEGKYNSQQYYVYKKTVAVQEGKTETVELGISGKGHSGLMYSVMVDWVDTANLTVTSSGQGTVTPSGTTSVIKGSEQTITAAPADGWMVESVKINGIDSAALESFNVTVDADTTVEVAFAEIPKTAPSVSTFEHQYIPDDKTGSVTFGTVTGDTDSVREYGVVYSETNGSNPEIGADGCYKLEAKKGLSDNGHYGIEIIGDLLLGRTYYTRSYVIYTNAEGISQTVYGDVKTISLK